MQESNLRPFPYQGNILTTELMRLVNNFEYNFLYILPVLQRQKEKSIGFSLLNFIFFFMAIFFKSEIEFDLINDKHKNI